MTSCLRTRCNGNTATEHLSLALLFECVIPLTSVSGCWLMLICGCELAASFECGGWETRKIPDWDDLPSRRTHRTTKASYQWCHGGTVSHAKSSRSFLCDFSPNLWDKAWVLQDAQTPHQLPPPTLQTSCRIAVYMQASLVPCRENLFPFVVRLHWSVKWEGKVSISEQTEWLLPLYLPSAICMETWSENKLWSSNNTRAVEVRM